MERERERWAWEDRGGCQEVLLLLFPLNNLLFFSLHGGPEHPQVEFSITVVKINSCW